MLSLITLAFFLALFGVYFLWRVKKWPKKCMKSVKTLIVVGSGGHTAEIMRLVSKFKPHYHPRLYVMADNDSTSRVKIESIEEHLIVKDYQIATVPRSRNVGQSYVTSVFTTVYAVIRSFSLVKDFSPDLVLCNGPGTCVPICLIAYFLSKLLGWGTKIVFVESICRVESLSLSAKILIYFADFIVVQWPELQVKYPRTVYIGKIF